MPPSALSLSGVSLNIKHHLSSMHGTHSERRSLVIAYYCSGHGYGHATRVSALTDELLARCHCVYICTNAPQHVFNISIAQGAIYRHALIDAGIVQPKAYDVARRETVNGLLNFMQARPKRVEEEVTWLREIRADVVLVDAPFLPCAAAARAGIPSIIVSNFTFDSCYSYLSVSTQADHRSSSLDGEPSNGHDEPERPISAEVLQPLVDQAIQDYSHASLLLRLPGAIPIPAFDTDVPLPASKWTNIEAHSFSDQITALLDRHPSTVPCASGSLSKVLRKVIDTPLIARPISANVYTRAKRREILQSVGVPNHLYDPHTTRILLVSFGGQSIPRPTSRSPSPAPSSTRTRQNSLSAAHPASVELSEEKKDNKAIAKAHIAPSSKTSIQRVMTSENMYLPGAPPALHLEGSDGVLSDLTAVNDALTCQDEVVAADGLLPPGWIAVVCGLGNGRGDEVLPEGFYAAPRDIYVPDLTAICDVVLGKLGYGTCSEAVSTQTPFLYGKIVVLKYSNTSLSTPTTVPRPLFVEEFGLKRLMERRGTSLPITRRDFEAGYWAQHILRIDKMGQAKKEQHRRDFARDSTKTECAATSIALEIERFMTDYNTIDNTTN